MSNELQKIIFGRNPVLEAIKSNLAIEKILISTTGDRVFEKEIRTHLYGKEIELQFVPKERLNKYTASNHQGVVAIINEYVYAQLDEIISGVKENALFLLLDQLTDIRNFGAIARSALIGGCDGIIIPASHSVKVTEDAMKSSAGALARIPVCKVNSLHEAADMLGSAGISLFAAAGEADKKLYELSFNQPCAIVLGSEKSGVSKNLLSRADEQFSIPQNDLLDSYNVSVSAGIILYQVYLSRNLKFTYAK
ncbi:MAG TPA: 23S rRNA (guanosine(2251)-2'-O)-methyltransferase RlmB [Saprospiraceae bacterium]|nr:23S rRNA (guanosine(2251)-2'-O)-methyltransferase RlmB [Saprospiraceae bacterium]HQW55320.1 23S rRNA (guanosine(2251)-2'-O)-methyltransferase RlmB [Saprospiraceae bacterium]